MTSIPESLQQVFEERLNQQIQTNNNISSLINQAKSGDKKYLPYGPILMNIYDQNKIKSQQYIYNNNVNKAKKQFCEQKCSGSQSCFNECDIYFNNALNYGMQHFSKVYKYSYFKTVKEEQ